MKPVCKSCGSTDVAWREGKQGGRYLIDTKRPHFCPKPTQTRRDPSPAVQGAIAGLVGLGYKEKAAKAMLAGVTGETEEELIQAVFAARAKELEDTKNPNRLRDIARPAW